jgi:hypothetical protein
MRRPRLGDRGRVLFGGDPADVDRAQTIADVAPGRAWKLSKAWQEAAYMAGKPPADYLGEKAVAAYRDMQLEFRDIATRARQALLSLRGRGGGDAKLIAALDELIRNGERMEKESQ